MKHKRTQTPLAEQYPSFSVLKAMLEYEERAAFVEMAHSSATECLFVPDPTSRVDINPQIEMPVFNDLMDDNIMPFWSCSLKSDADGVLPKAGTNSLLNTANRSSGSALLRLTAAAAHPEFLGRKEKS
ncbi:MAG TPA: hypothetical protein VHQ01_11315, partial [Pyrinomonadaceae bacterium]|nr:hypothetical protein [Pyrinomonadaceae bacterium]